MISRIKIRCKTCSKAITARVQVGHENEQRQSFQCPHCETGIVFTLDLSNPPSVFVNFVENCERSEEEGIVYNMGVGFTIPEDLLHQDFYFPSFTQLPTPPIPTIPSGSGPVFLDMYMALGGFAGATGYWSKLRKAYKFHESGQEELRNIQIESMLSGAEEDGKNIENAFFNFLSNILGSNPEEIVDPLFEQVHIAKNNNKIEFLRFINDYDAGVKKDRFASYVEIINEYFKCYEEFNQTAIYARKNINIPDGSMATSVDFDSTKMFYGNAFEVLGSNLDVVASINNMVCGRSYDQMLTMDLKHYRGINKANRTKCFSNNQSLCWLVEEYDSQIRNASHHRWFKIDKSGKVINYRSGGTGALHKMPYAEYLYKCNRIFFRICALACVEILMLNFFGKGI